MLRFLGRVRVHALRRGARWVALATAGAIALGGLATAGQAAYPGSKGVIAYGSSGGVTGEVYGEVALSLWAMNPDGSAAQALHQNYVGDSLEHAPVWSPDGNTVAYTRCAGVLFGCDASREVWLRDADGSNPRRVTTGTHPSWLPDGSSLVVIDSYSFPLGGSSTQIYRVNLDGSGKTLISEPDSCGKAFPKVSPDGTRIGFQWGCPYLDKVTGVYAMPIGGGVPTRLTPDTPQYESYGGYDWSPDGARIVYSREQNAPLGSGETLDLYVVQLGTGVSTRLTSTKYTTGFAPAEEGPVFSPDGTRIAYHRQGDIWVMNADGSGQAPLTATSWSESWPSWQPCRPGTRYCSLAPKPTSPPPPSPPSPPGPDPAPPAPSPPAAATVGDFGISCGTTRWGWHHVTKEPTFVGKGEYACVVLLSNRVSRGLIETARVAGWTLTKAYVRTHYDALRSADWLSERKADSYYRRAMKRIFPEAAKTMSRMNVIFRLGKLAGYNAQVLKGLFVLHQYTAKGACAQFLVDVDNRKLLADWSIVYNPRYFSDVKLTHAGVWQLEERRLAMDKVRFRQVPLRCDSNGFVTKAREASVFSGGATQIIRAPATLNQARAR